MNSEIIAITGATGYLGQFIVRYFARKGYTIRALTRNIENSKQIFHDVPDIQWYQGDLDPQANYQEFLHDAHGLIHSAFSHIPGRYRGGEGDDLEGFMRINLEGSLNLLRQAKLLQYGVFLSSRAVYGTSIDNDEDAKITPDSHYGLMKKHIEDAIIQEKLPFAILRATGVYGLINPVTQSKWFDLVQTIVQKKYWEGNHAGTEVHGEDLAHAILMLCKPQYHGQIFNCSDFYISHREIAQIVYDLIGSNGDLPRLPTREVVPMPTHKLHALGWKPKGKVYAATVIQELIKSCKTLS